MNVPCSKKRAAFYETGCDLRLHDAWEERCNPDLGLSGLASGFDWKTLVNQFADVGRTPQTRLRVEQNLLNQRKLAFGSIKTELSILQNRANTLKDASLYDSRTAQTSDSTLATTAAAAGAAIGTFAFNVTQMATAARINGTINAGSKISADGNLSAVTLANAGFSTAVSAGIFTVNGKQVTVATTDTLQQVFDKIAAVTDNHVTASYDTGSDKITLASDIPANEIVLGTAADTSNFLQVARLANNGTGAITSSLALGGVRLNHALSNANFTTAVSDGGSGQGEFKINGVSIEFNATTDSVTTVLNRINSSNAGVTAGYDAVNDRFILSNKTAGDIGISMEDVTGNFLAATGLLGSALQHGANLTYTLDGGDPIVSTSNTISEASSGIIGLSATALKNGEFTVTVGSDTAKVKTAINDFIDAYNRAQTVIDTQTASSTDAKGVVTAGTLASDNDASDIATRLRSTVFTSVPGLSGVLKHLADLGITTSGDDNKFTLDDSEKFDSALANNLTSVKALFSDATNGLAVKLSAYLDHTIGEDGTLVSHQDSLSKQASGIDTRGRG